MTTGTTHNLPKAHYHYIFPLNFSYKSSLKLAEYKVEDLPGASMPPSNSILSTSSFLQAAANGGTLGRRVMRRESSRYGMGSVIERLSRRK